MLSLISADSLTALLPSTTTLPPGYFAWAHHENIAPLDLLYGNRFFNAVFKDDVSLKTKFMLMGQLWRSYHR